ncbi:hypothetical protein N7510_004931 [Penicillium lagena]|uniref:uncharacterized protein n=1 Tax=Penicillium lagena TaxID=94218 RepID=UPI00253FB59E|nr:uncharacterized protein N7510_004931 [Penicillium lagena]KAJ5620947.1 hypothetical protein N7510_004931 [Penicillium lagena]
MAPPFTSIIVLAVCITFSPLASADLTRSAEVMAPAATFQANDSCMKIAIMHPDMGGLNQLYAWNPQIHRGSCENLGVNEIVCIKMQPAPQCPPTPTMQGMQQSSTSSGGYPEAWNR